ncbi:Coiled-coil domain-containing protein 39 [Symbiodinium microadriaticum]|uniref:Coiled-coil domain-containing protein 39 n=1 Tax=Symbiodinium microadriaticum TaxID=2951 RepID=A0A1Q9ENI3_SYMMI|nr:Coiled-coil domain-containing protein 39 [Symbiodinium microadriaticum]
MFLTRSRRPELVNTQQLVDAKRNEASTEEHLQALTNRQLGRLKSEIVRLHKVLEDTQDQINAFSNELMRGNEKLDQSSPEMFCACCAADAGNGAVEEVPPVLSQEKALEQVPEPAAPKALQETPAATAEPAEETPELTANAVTFTFKLPDGSVKNINFDAKPLGMDFFKTTPLCPLAFQAFLRGIKAVKPNSLAEKAGILPQWVMTHTQGEPMPDDLNASIVKLSQAVKDLKKAANAGSRAEPPLFKLEMNWNQEELEQWAIAARQKEEDELTLEKYRRADDSKETMIRCRPDVLDAIVYNAVRVDMTQRSATTSTLGQLLMYRLRICPFGKVTRERCELREDAHCCHIKPSDPDYGQFKVVDLDLPPEQRWAAAMKNAAEKMITHFKSFVGVLSEELFKLIEDSPKFKKLAEQVLTDMGRKLGRRSEYGLEMRGIANATGMRLREGAPPSSPKMQMAMWYMAGEDWKHLQWTLTEERLKEVKRSEAKSFDSLLWALPPPHEM